MSVKRDKRKKALAEKKARKRAGFKRPGKSKYALKKRAQGNGKYSPRSPFRVEVTVTETDEAA